MVERDGSGQATAVVGVGAGSVGDVLLGDHLAHVHAGLAHHLHNHIAAEHIPSVVEHQQQNAVTLVGHLYGLEYHLRIGSCKHVAHHLDIQHAAAYETDYGDSVCILKGLADNQMPLNIHYVLMGQRHAFQQFIGEGIGVVEKLLHFHSAFPPV